jgi:anti-anti-sigma factor
VRVAATEDGIRTVAVTGEIDLSNADGVEDCILDLISNDLVGIVLDLTGVTYLDSTGLKLLFTLATRLDISQIELALVVADDSPVRRVLELSGVGESVPLRAPQAPQA